MIQSNPQRRKFWQKAGFFERVGHIRLRLAIMENEPTTKTRRERFFLRGVFRGVKDHDYGGHDRGGH